LKITSRIVSAGESSKYACRDRTRHSRVEAMISLLPAIAPYVAMNLPLTVQHYRSACHRFLLDKAS
jgi:hypothetical protein